jgi:hypothetical protein
MAQQTTRSTAYRAVDSVIANGGKAYDRGRMLVRVLPLGPDDISGNEPETTRRIVLKLASALRTSGRAAAPGIGPMISTATSASYRR